MLSFEVFRNTQYLKCNFYITFQRFKNFCTINTEILYYKFHFKNDTQENIYWR